MKRHRLTFRQYCAWRAATRLNHYRTFAELRDLYRRVASGAEYGLRSGLS